MWILAVAIECQSFGKVEVGMAGPAEGPILPDIVMEKYEVLVREGF